MNEDLPEGGHKSDADWLRDAFDRALRGDNGTTSEAMTPAVSPFETAPIKPIESAESEPFDPNATVPIEPWELPQVSTDASNDQGVPSFVSEGTVAATDAEPVADVLGAESDIDEPITEPAVVHDPFATAIFDALQEYDEPVVSEDDVDNEPDAFDFLFGGGSVTETSTDSSIAAPSAAPTTPTTAPTDATASAADTTVALPVPGLVPVASAAATASAAPRVARAPREPNPRRTRTILIAVSAGLGVALLSVGAYFGGTLLATPAPSATPTETALPDTARPAGEWAWDELVGGECISGTTSPWEATYTVVDCSTSHDSQLVFRGDLVADAQVTAYPGDDAIGGVVGPLCATEGVVDLAAAGELTDVVVSASYAASAADWDAGNTSFFCFVSRTGGELTGSLAGTALVDGLTLPQPADADATNP